MAMVEGRVVGPQFTEGFRLVKEGDLTNRLRTQVNAKR